MAYLYQTGTANDVPHWFSLLETFLVGRGWTVVSGTGTTTVVFNSIGEAGGRAKLFIRFRQDGAALEKVWYAAQDDAGGTHRTIEHASYTSGLLAPGGGLIPFVYFMAADKDKVIVNFKAGLGYTGCYVGVVEPFALAVDEEEQMVSIALHTNLTAYVGAVLKNDAGIWTPNVLTGGQSTSSTSKDPLDNSISVFGWRVHEGTTNKTVGQPTDVSGKITSCPGLNPEDTITTGYAGATSTWVVMGTGANRWCMRTGGVVPVGQLEGAHFAHTNGLATSQADFEAKLLAFMTAIGWTKVANPAPIFPIDYFWNSPGESGVDDIYLHWYYDNGAPKRYKMGVSDDTALTHQTSVMAIAVLLADFPTYYYITADRDCLFVTLEVAGIYNYMWAGMYQSFLPDPDSIATIYKVGTPDFCLRGHEGSWSLGLSDLPDGSGNSSPNLYDGVTNIVWQYVVAQAATQYGSCKYLHRLSGPAFSVMDTVAIGGRSFRYFATGLAFREA